MREGKRYGFIYSPEAMLCLAEAIGPSTGLLVDCYHWYTALGTTADLRSLRAEDVVYVHVNDAPEGIPVEQQLDQVRRLPGASGVIDIAGFLQALREVGYDGPVTPEPFEKQLAAINPDEACRVAREHMQKIWAHRGIGINDPGHEQARINECSAIRLFVPVRGPDRLMRELLRSKRGAGRLAWVEPAVSAAPPRPPRPCAGSVARAVPRLPRRAIGGRPDCVSSYGSASRSYRYSSR